MNAYERAIEHWGKEKQIEKALEELKELRLELIRALRGFPNKEAILTEMADVHNMLIQIRMIFDIKGVEVDDEMVRKMRRTMERIDKEESEGSGDNG